MSINLSSYPSRCFFILEFQLFLILLSVRSGNIFENWAHLLPLTLKCKNRSHRSWSVQGSLLISGRRWLCHLSRHYFPILPGKKEAIIGHFNAPCSSTNFFTFSSSSGDQGSLINLKIKIEYFFWSYYQSFFFM